MRRKLSLLAVGLVAGATIATPAAPAHAQECDARDPVVDYVCTTVENVGPWVNYYYDLVGDVVLKVYCTLWDCP